MEYTRNWRDDLEMVYDSLEEFEREYNYEISIGVKSDRYPVNFFHILIYNGRTGHDDFDIDDVNGFNRALRLKKKVITVKIEKSSSKLKGSFRKIFNRDLFERNFGVNT